MYVSYLPRLRSEFIGCPAIVCGRHSEVCHESCFFHLSRGRDFSVWLVATRCGRQGLVCFTLRSNTHKLQLAFAQTGCLAAGAKTRTKDPNHC